MLDLLDDISASANPSGNNWSNKCALLAEANNISFKNYPKWLTLAHSVPFGREYLLHMTRDVRNVKVHSKLSTQIAGVAFVEIALDRATIPEFTAN